MQDIKRISVLPDTTLQEALKIFGVYDGVRLLIVVDKDDNFLGIITDPDIRRGLTKGLNLSSPIQSIIQKSPITASIHDSKQKLIALSAQHNIYEIPLLDDNGRIVAIESISSLLRETRLHNTIVIMAGGLGMRLRPLTESIPKPMLKVGSKPILQIILERFKSQGFYNIVLCVNYKSHIIEDYFGDGHSFGLSITYIKEEKALGTAGALSLIDADFLSKGENQSFFVMNGDILSDIDFTKMLSFHTQSNACATMGVREYSMQVPYGVVECEENKIVKLTEKPVQNVLVNAGIYCLKPQALSLIPKDTFFDMPHLFNTLLSQTNYDVRSYLITDYWIDIGAHEEYERANNEYRF
ncbi:MULTISPECIES: nucleotidyltransferase family protein [Helicobacter]|mgnify:CR=1 FL=1|uniref:Nucleotidyltransferase family protein n=5 Tax=Helicobacter TaxID=209 RepID=A0ABZ3F5A5_9HELI|nr:nucleotidyltransferase family protein [Helicobacter japonicus]